MRVWAVVLVSVAACWLAQPALAISRAQANQLALKALAPESQPGNVVVFGLPSPLKASDAVFEGGTPTATNKRLTRAVKPFGKKVWLFWEDIAYGARFQHPSRLLVLADATGAVVSSTPLRWYPLVNGKAPAFAAGSYQSDTYKIYSSVTAKSASVAWRPHWLFARPSDLPANALKDDCLIMIGLRRDPQFSADFAGMGAAARQYGLPAYYVNANTAGSDPNGQDLADAVKQVVRAPINCKDVMIYIDGHGYETGPTGVNVGTRTTPAGVNARGQQLVYVRPAVVTSDDLISILKANAETTFKFVIDACYSGRFLLDIPPAEHPNLLILTTASKADTYSYSFVKSAKINGTVVVNHTNNPGVSGAAGTGRGEFTNGFLAGLAQFAGSPAAIADAQAAGGSFLGQMLKFAYNNEKANDFAATTGLTNPLEQDRLPTKATPPPPPPPVNFSITANGWWQHNVTDAPSAVCFGLITIPAQAGATGTATVTGGTVVGPRSLTFTTGATGMARARFGISSFGVYDGSFSITSGGVTRTATASVNVTAAAGTATCAA